MATLRAAAGRDGRPLRGPRRARARGARRAVLERNPELEAARYAWRAALARDPQETALDDPMLGYGVAPRSFGSSERRHRPARRRCRSASRSRASSRCAARSRSPRPRPRRATTPRCALRLATLASLLFDEYYLAARELAMNARAPRAARGAAARSRSRATRPATASQQDPAPGGARGSASALHREVMLADAPRHHGRADERAAASRARRSRCRRRRRRSSRSRPDGAERDALARTRARGAPRARAPRGARARARGGGGSRAARVPARIFTLIGAYDRSGRRASCALRRRRARAAAPARAAARRARRGAAPLEQARSTSAPALGRPGAARACAARASGSPRRATRCVLVRDRQLPAARDQVEAARAALRDRAQRLLRPDRGASAACCDVELGDEEARAEVSRRRAELDARARRACPGRTGEETP